MMSNNNNNNPNDPSSKETKERQEEMEILGRFRNVISNKLEQMTEETEEKQEIYKMGDHEKKVLMEMQGMGMKEGIAAGVATFILLRRGPLWIGKYIIKRRGGGASNPAANNISKNPFHNNASKNSSANYASGGGGGGGYQLSNPVTGYTVANTNTNPNFPRSRSPIVRGVWFMVDATLSLMMAANTSLQYTDLKRIRTDLVELPLAEGRSLVSDAFCQELTQALQQIQQEDSPAYQRLVSKYNQNKGRRQQQSSDNMFSGSDSEDGISPLALYMEGITLFSQNCERRAYRQRELFQEQGGAQFDGFDIANDSDNRSTSSLSLEVGGSGGSSSSSSGGSTSSSSSSTFHSNPIPAPGVAKDGPRLVRTLPKEGDHSMEGDEEYTVVYNSNSSDADGSDDWGRS